MDTTNVPVLVGACLCPGTPHQDGDFVYLRAKLGLAAGTTLQRLIVEANQERNDSAELTGKLAEAYLLVGIESWDLQSPDGEPIPVNPGSIKEQLLDDFERSAPVADKADDLYMGPVLSPLVRRAVELSSTSMTNGSTSAKPAGRSKARKRLKPSSITTIPTAAIERTSA
jgi:hypothetical protein